MFRAFIQVGNDTGFARRSQPLKPPNYTVIYPPSRPLSPWHQAVANHLRLTPDTQINALFLTFKNCAKKEQLFDKALQNSHLPMIELRRNFVI